MKNSYFENTDINPYQVLTIYPTELSIFGSHTFHELMLSDDVRMRAYKNAITAAGRDHPNANWVDIGSGLCPLSLFAAQLGSAKRVTAIEGVKSTYDLSKMIVDSQPSGISKKIQIINGYSYDINFPHPFDFLITETIGNFGFEEGIIALINDAKKRFLTKNTVIIPSEIELYVSPIESFRCEKRITYWKSKKHGLDFSKMIDRASNTVYHHRASKDELLGRPVKCYSIDFMKPGLIPEKLNFKSEHVIERSGTLHGFIGWFRARLYKNIYLSNNPLIKNTSFNWTQAFFPICFSSKTSVRKGQKLNFNIEWDFSKNTLHWES